jgi:hypothetical protein
MENSVIVLCPCSDGKTFSFECILERQTRNARHLERSSVDLPPAATRESVSHQTPQHGRSSSQPPIVAVRSSSSSDRSLSQPGDVNNQVSQPGSVAIANSSGRFFMTYRNLAYIYS